MTHREEAKRTAMAYAWGREDASGVKTAEQAGGDQTSPSGWMAFSEAYAQGQEDYNTQARHMMIPVRDAYESWQASGGRSVFQRGELTLPEDQRRMLRAAWPDSWTADPQGAMAAYYEQHRRWQDAAWAALGLPELTWYPASSADASHDDKDTDLGSTWGVGASWATVVQGERRWSWHVYARWLWEDIDADPAANILAEGSAPSQDHAQTAVAAWVASQRQEITQ